MHLLYHTSISMCIFLLIKLTVGLNNILVNPLCKNATKIDPKRRENVESKLNKFLCYLLVERGFSQGTIKAYQLDIERGLIPFLHQGGKFEVGEVTKADIRDYLDYVATSRAAIKSFFNYLVENEGLEANLAASIRSPRIPEKECTSLLRSLFTFENNSSRSQATNS